MKTVKIENVSIKKNLQKLCSIVIFAGLLVLTVFKYVSLFADGPTFTPLKHDKQCFKRFVDKDKRHMRINKECGDRRLFIIGDVHGCYNAFQDLLKKANISCSKDLVILSGDFCNKGPRSRDMLRYIRSSPTCVLSVMGNHEYKVLEYIKRRKKKIELSEEYKMNGMKWVDELDVADLNFIQKLPYTISIPSFNTIVVHAQLNHLLPLIKQNKKLLMSIKHRNRTDNNGKNKINKAYNQTYKIKPGLQTLKNNSKNMEKIKMNVEEKVESDKKGWAAEWDGPQLVVFGHDSIRGLQVYPNALGLDTGCIYGNELTGVRIIERHNRSAATKHQIISVKSPSDCSPNWNTTYNKLNTSIQSINNTLQTKLPIKNNKE